MNLNSACNCCQPPPFTNPLMEIRYSEILRGKCAFKIDGSYYKKRIREYVCINNANMTYQETETRITLEEWFDPERITSFDCSTSSSYDPPRNEWMGGCTEFFQYNYIEGSETGEEEYTDEEFDGQIFQLITNAPITFDGFSEGYPAVGSGLGVTAYAGYTTNGDEAYAASYEYRISHNPSASCYLKVWISEIKCSAEFQNSLLEILSETKKEYVWNPTSNPCIANPDKSFLAEENLIKSNTFILDPFEKNTITVAFINKFSFLEDYEPDDAIADFSNGFVLSRPSPDLNPNGVPLGGWQ